SAQGISCCAIKPVAAGCEWVDGQMQNADARLLRSAATSSLSYAQVNPVALELACAPHIAAKQEGRRLQVARLEGFCRGVLMQRSEVCVIEGAGGWRVPLNERELLSDLVKVLNAPVVLVVAMRLGCLNHALLTAEAIARDGLPLVGWVANCMQPEDMPFLEDNIATLKQVLPAPCLGVVPHLQGDESSKVEQVAGLLALPALK
ncbi:MAG TPA: dethiobiotin synthase, partial [Marinagarivorans sp.]